MIGNDVAGTGVVPDVLGGVTGLRVPTYLEFGGTLPTTGAIRFPKPSELSTLMTIRREASAVDIPILTSTTDTGLVVGDIATGTFNELKLQATSAISLFAPTTYLRDTGGGTTIRSTWTIAAASLWNTAASTSMEFQYNGTTRIKYDVTGWPSTTGPPLLNRRSPAPSLRSPTRLQRPC